MRTTTREVESETRLRLAVLLTYLYERGEDDDLEAEIFCLHNPNYALSGTTPFSERDTCDLLRELLSDAEKREERLAVLVCTSKLI